MTISFGVLQNALFTNQRAVKRYIALAIASVVKSTKNKAITNSEEIIRKKKIEIYLNYASKNKLPKRPVDLY